MQNAQLAASLHPVLEKLTLILRSDENIFLVPIMASTVVTARTPPLPELVVSRIADYFCVTDTFWTNREILEIADNICWPTFSKYLYGHLQKQLSCHNTLGALANPGALSVILEDTLVSIKEAARELGVSPTGTKATVFARVVAAHAQKVKDYELKQRNQLTEADREKIRDVGRKVYLTTAKTVYGLTDKDLKDVPHELVRNPRFRSAAPGRIYDIHLIRELARKKYGSYAEFEEISSGRKKKLEERRERRDASQQRLRDMRRNQLEMAFAPYELEIRDDSRLCNAYIETGNGDPERIAVILNEMRFYWNHTDYDDFFEQVRDEEREYRGRYDRDEVSDEAKDLALSAWVREKTSVEEALKAPELPASLRDKVMAIGRRR